MADPVHDDPQYINEEEPSHSGTYPEEDHGHYGDEMNESYVMEEDEGEEPFLPTSQSDLGASTGSFLDPAERNDPNYLFGILQDALPLPEALTEVQRRDLSEVVWERVRRWLWSNPSLSQRQAAADVRGAGDATCLHLICRLHNPPEDIVGALIEAGHESVQFTDNHGWIPLHHACANGASPEVMKLLVDAYPEGRVAQDHQSRTPLHFYASRRSDHPNVITLNAELLSDSGAAALTDRSGMLPLHYAAAYGSHPAILKVLARVYPESLAAQEDNGRTPMHVAMSNARHEESPNVIRFLLSHPESRKTIDKRDNNNCSPLHLLAKQNSTHEERPNVAECLDLYLAAEPKAGGDFLTAIQKLPDWLQDTAVVSKHVRNILNEKIVQRFPTSIMMADGLVLIVLIVCFAFATSNHIDLQFDPIMTQDNTAGPLALLFVGAGYFLLRELVQVASLLSLGSLGSWVTDPANYLDMLVIALVGYHGILMLDDSSVDGNFRAGVAFTQGVLWTAMIVYLKSTLVDFAVFVGGVFYVVQKLVTFLIAVGVILLAFAQMFYFVYVHTDMCGPESGALGNLAIGDVEVENPGDCQFPHCQFGRSLLKVYTMMMGEIGDETRYSTNTTAQILYVFYAFLVVILLSNVLIAIVTDSYEIIQNDRAAIVFWSNRLDFVAEMDTITYAVHRFLGRSANDKNKDLNETPESAAQANNLSIDDALNGFGEQEEMTTANPEGSPEDELPDPLLADESTEFFREAWHQVLLLFDANLYEDIDWIEMWVYNIFRIFSIFCVIPLWLTVGFVTLGWLWPPQVRIWLFVQKATVASRAEMERQKLSQLTAIQADLKTLKQEIMREMANDRDEMIRMKAEVETVQGEVYADLQQVKELMDSLLAI